MKNPLTPAGIEPATFRFVAQHLNHCATAIPQYLTYIAIIFFCQIFLFHIQDSCIFDPVIVQIFDNGCTWVFVTMEKVLVNVVDINIVVDTTK